MNIETIILCLFKKSEAIISKPSQIHKAFYKVKYLPKYRDLLKTLLFTGSPVNPFSEKLNEIFFNLQYVDAIHLHGNELGTYVITENFKELYEDSIKDIDSITLERIGEMCEYILEYMRN